jgi:hypothetical protein
MLRRPVQLAARGDHGQGRLLLGIHEGVAGQGVIPGPLGYLPPHFRWNGITQGGHVANWTLTSRNRTARSARIDCRSRRRRWK